MLISLNFFYDYLSSGFVSNGNYKIKKNKIKPSIKYCLYCGTVLDEYFIREHINHEDHYWCSFICYKLYRADLNKKTEQTKDDRSYVRP